MRKHRSYCSLAGARASLDPEQARLAPPSVQPDLVGIKHPLSSAKLGNVTRDITTETDRFEHFSQATNISLEFACLAFYKRNGLDQFLLVPVHPIYSLNLAEPNVFPLAKILPLQVANGHRRANFFRWLEQDRIDGLVPVERQGNFVTADSGFTC
jgi:hypothetical protein